jgi:signal recognition particle subunit SRP54
MAGLQGSGKTTASGKLALWFKSQGRNPLLVGADLQRPAAVEQLRTLGASIDVPVFSEPKDPVKVAKAGMKEANRLGRDVVIVDTAGRLAIDQELMAQVRDISKQVKPDYTFLVVDAMTGQDAVQTALSFHQTLELDGVILTKLDGDARGGAALSIRAVTGVPIKFVGVGEKADALEPFHPDRFASRILGMGDMLTLIEKAKEELSDTDVESLTERMKKGALTLDDFLEQYQRIKRMGPISNLLGMLPGFSQIKKQLNVDDMDEKYFSQVEAVIQSMTKDERATPDIIDGSRRRRIAAGSGTTPADINRLLKQYNEAKKVIQQISSGKGPDVSQLLR